MINRQLRVISFHEFREACTWDREKNTDNFKNFGSGLILMLAISLYIAHLLLHFISYTYVLTYNIFSYVKKNINFKK